MDILSNKEERRVTLELHQNTRGGWFLIENRFPGLSTEDWRKKPEGVGPALLRGT